jgi:DNA-binding NtrC family response regulator
MTTEVIIASRNGNVTCIDCKVEQNNIKAIIDIRMKFAPAICLIREDCMNLLKEVKERFEYKSRLKGVELWRYYNLKSNRILLINGLPHEDRSGHLTYGFSDVFGHFQTSISAFLENIESPDVFVLLCVSEKLLSQTKAELASAARPRQGVDKKGKKRPKYDENSLALEDRYAGNSAACLKVRQHIVLAARKTVKVLILGETGTGKEIVARAIHDLRFPGNNPANPFEAVNCGAIPPDMFESELFGTVPGAFTDARDKMGKWEAANNGTLFLDEIGDLSPHHQVKILRALEEEVICRLGSTKDIPVNAQIIAATNKDLDGISNLERYHFREDLYHRIAALTIRTPALSEHPEDIPVIALNLWRKITKDSLAGLPREVLDRLEKTYWPGNVRSLKLFLERLLVHYESDSITPEAVNGLLDEEILHHIRPPYLDSKGKKPSWIPEDLVKDIDHMEGYMSILRKAKDIEIRSAILEKVHELIFRMIGSNK